jgi:uncharacterized small protein (DUF1192 family)
MTGLSEAFLALKNVMLLHERVEGLQRELERLTNDQKALNAAVTGIDRRVIRIEALIEYAARGSAVVPRIEK